MIRIPVDPDKEEQLSSYVFMALFVLEAIHGMGMSGKVVPAETMRAQMKVGLLFFTSILLLQSE